MAGKIEQALKIYDAAVREFLVQQLKQHYGSGKDWVEAYARALNDHRRSNYLEDLKRGKMPEEAVDLAHFKSVLLGNRDVFKPVLKKFFNRAITWADEIQEVRNNWAHLKDVPPEDEYRLLDNVRRLLRAIGYEEEAKKVRAMMDAKPASLNEAGGIKGKAAEWKMPWWEWASPHGDIRYGKFDENTFAAKLDEVVNGHASNEYLFADEFFQKTYLTKELKNILGGALLRLAGKGGEAVVQLRTPFGGGKTHALIALYHLVNDSAVTGELDEIKKLLAEVDLDDVPRARVAVLVGTSLDPQGRMVEEGVRINTLWGELAYQLGGKQGYEIIAESDKARTAPGKERVVELLRRYSPALILMDEVLLYLVKAAGVQVGETSLQAQTLSFLQELTEAAGNVDGIALLTTFPESHLEYMEADPEKVDQVYGRLERVFGRVQAVKVPVKDNEIYAVIRHRLFESIDEQAVKKIAGEYHKLLRSYDDLPEKVKSPRYRELIEQTYPFHPELIDLLYKRWGTIPGFQKTRGVLQLLARITEKSYNSGRAKPIISPGDVDLTDPDLRATVTKPLRDANWDAVIASDIVEKAREIDNQKGGDYKKRRLAESVATAIFMYSHSGGVGEGDGVSKPELDASLIYPDGITRELISDALDRMKGKLFYLHEDGKWVFRAQPNLNAVLNEEIDLVEDAQVRDRLQKYVQKVAGRGVFRAIIWPTNHKDVPDDTVLKIILYGLDSILDSSSDDGQEDQARRNRDVIQQNAPGGPRVNKNTLIHVFLNPDSVEALRSLARQEIALERLQGRGERLSLNAGQKAEIEERTKKVKTRLPDLVRASYSEIYEPISGAPEYRYHSAKQYAQTAESIVDLVAVTLRGADRLLDEIDPGIIAGGGPLDLWPQSEPVLTLGKLKEYFYRLPELPMIESAEVLKKAVEKGVRSSIFDLAVKDESRDQGWRLIASGRKGTVDFLLSDTYAIVRSGYLQGEEEGASDTGVSRKPEAGEDAVPVGTGGKKGDFQTGVSKTNRPIRIAIRMQRLSSDNIPNLIDVIQALRDAGGSVNLAVEIVATNNEKGLDEGVLSLTVRELLDQNGIEYEWEEERG